jgi:competence protein ComEA
MAGKQALAKILLEKPYLITFALAGILVAAAGAVLAGLNFPKAPAPAIEIIESAPTPKNFLVDVGGAVENPGIYEFGPEARLNDALVAAGGLDKDADTDWVSHNLNLAGKLTDGAKIYVPYRGEGEVAGVAGGTDLININTAPLTELDRLWGIGPVTAQKIIEGRPYTKTADLLEKKIVKANVFEAIKDEISAY